MCWRGPEPAPLLTPCGEKFRQVKVLAEKKGSAHARLTEKLRRSAGFAVTASDKDRQLDHANLEFEPRLGGQLQRMLGSTGQDCEY